MPGRSIFSPLRCARLAWAAPPGWSCAGLASVHALGGFVPHSETSRILAVAAKVDGRQRCKCDVRTETTGDPALRRRKEPLSMKPLRAPAILGLFPGIVLFACSDVPIEPIGQGRFPTIYGSADIHEPFAYADAAWAAEAAEFSVAVFDASALDESNPNDIRQRANWTVTTRLQAQTGRPLCAGELFETQPALSACSGVLIAEDLVLTAGHCTNGCGDLRFVFDYALTPSGTLPTLTQDDVYRCDATVAEHDSPSGLDYAILHLTRP